VTKDLKRSLTIAGHRTSISLEPEFWDALGTMAKAENKSVSAVVGEIDQTRGGRNLSSAIRVKILNHLSATER
jgi:predicted DNA-binding ribbon-helix-helix protein